MRKLKKLNLVIGIGCIILFLFKIVDYKNTACVEPYFYGAICGKGAMTILIVYGVFALFGVYLIITSFKRKKNGDDKNKSENKSDGVKK